MQYQKLTKEQKKIRDYRRRLAEQVGKIQAECPRMSRADSLRLAKELLRSPGLGTATKKRQK